MKENLKLQVDAWHAANPNIMRFWWDVGNSVIRCVKMRTSVETHGLIFTYQSGMMFITLPSERQLAYVKPRIGINRFGSDCVTYEGASTGNKWERSESYGPKFVENIVQATARDILCYAIETLKDYDIVAHVHDEVIIEADKNASVDEVCTLMSQTPPWADGLILNADGYECEFYKKE